VRTWLSWFGVCLIAVQHPARSPRKRKNFFSFLSSHPFIELELELIQTQMTQKPVLRAEMYARALRASQNREEDSV
jgi:hypothetical protein